MTTTGVWQANRLSKEIDIMQTNITAEENAILERDRVTKNMRDEKNKHIEELKLLKQKHQKLGEAISVVESFNS